MAIQYKRLGAHGVLVSNLCLGTMNFGPQASEKESFAIMDRALELGINFFDTADIYGGPQRGLTEEIVGKWLAQGGGRRQAIVLATKVFNPANREGERPEPNHSQGNLSAVKIQRHCHDSLKRLRTETIDLYQMHHVDRACPWEEIWQAMGSLITQGKVVYVGSSNFAGWDIATACQEGLKRGMSGLVSEQSIYNLNNRMVELEVIPACRHYGMGLLPWSPLGGGLLAGALEKATIGRRGRENFPAMVEKNRAKLEAYESLCREIGEKPAIVGLAWLLRNRWVTAPIVGPRTVEQLESAVRATEITLDEKVAARLEEIFPGPGGEAPKAYAW